MLTHTQTTTHTHTDHLTPTNMEVIGSWQEHELSHTHAHWTTGRVPSVVFSLCVPNNQPSKRPCTAISSAEPFSQNSNCGTTASFRESHHDGLVVFSGRWSLRVSLYLIHKSYDWESNRSRATLQMVARAQLKACASVVRNSVMTNYLREGHATAGHIRRSKFLSTWLTVTRQRWFVF